MRMMPLLLLTGCQKFGGLSGLSEALKGYTPTVSFQSLSMTDINFDSVSVDLLFNVNNPNPLKVSLASMDYALALEGLQVLSGEKSDGLSLPADGSAELTVPLTLNFAEFADLLDTTRGKDELAFALSGKLGFDTPAGVLPLPYEAAGDMPVLRAPGIKLSGLRLEEIALLQNRASLALDLDVSNRGSANIALSSLKYDLSLGGSDAASGTASTLGTVSGDETATLTLPIELSLTGLGSGIIDAIQSRGEIDVGLTATASIDTPFGAIPLDFTRSKSLSVKQ